MVNNVKDHVRHIIWMVNHVNHHVHHPSISPIFRQISGVPMTPFELLGFMNLRHGREPSWCVRAIILKTLALGPQFTSKNPSLNYQNMKMRPFSQLGVSIQKMDYLRVSLWLRKPAKSMRRYAWYPKRQWYIRSSSWATKRQKDVWLPRLAGWSVKNILIRKNDVSTYPSSSNEWPIDL